MRAILIFMVGLVAGASLVTLGVGSAVRAQGTPSGNGDVNGDESIDISDAVYLLAWLFQGGPEPVPIECVEPPTGTVRFRILSDIRCDQAAVTALLDVCGSTATDATDAPGTIIPSDCAEGPAMDSCELRVRVSTSCGSLDFCRVLDTSPLEVYDVVLYFDEVRGAPSVVYFRGTAEEDGGCPPFPTPGMPVSGEFADCTGVGAGAGAAATAGWEPNR